MEDLIMKKMYTIGKFKTEVFDFRSKISKLCLMAFMLVLGQGVFANDSELSIEKWNSGAFIVELDHVRHKVKGEFYTDGLEEGKHRLKILQPQINVHTGVKRMKVVYTGFIDIPRGTRTEAMIKKNHTFKIMKQIVLHKPKPVCPDYDSDEYFVDEDVFFEEVEEVEVVETCPAPVAPTPCNGHEQIEDEGVFEVELIMNEHDFNDLIEMLENEWFDSSKMSTAKQALRSNTMSAEQVKELIETFTFESTRLEMAKFAYEYTLDTENYYIIFSTLNYSSSIKELELWISERDS